MDVLTSKAPPPVLISEAYRKSQEEFHSLRPEYGISGQAHFAELLELAKLVKAETVLDYGCGKAILAKLWPLYPTLISYDPCIPEHAAPPPPCDLVYCGDVLEHVEPEFVAAVLDNIRRLTLKAVFLVICTEPAVKTLQDGRNAHLIQEGPQWWMETLGRRFAIDNLLFDGRDILLAGRPI